ncbi:MAG: hypothetical protein SWQ30_01995 [Thermodesulfobacteriota bacterium]|nr:hypothetical protein [Thermodesulfobacteriota bacterium]
MSDEERQTKGTADASLPEAGEGEGAASSSLNQDDIAKLLGEAGEENQEEENQEQEAGPRKEIDNDQAAPGKEPVRAEGLDGDDFPEDQEPFSTIEGSENLEEDDATAQADEEFLAKLEVLENEQPEANHDGGPKEEELEADNMSVGAESDEEPSSEEEKSDVEENATGDEAAEDKAGEEESLPEESEEVTEEDDGEESRDDGESVEEHGVDAQGDGGSTTQAQDSHDQEAGDNGEDSTAEDDPQGDDEAVASGSDEDLSSGKKDEGAEEDGRGDSEGEDGPDEQEQDTAPPEGLSEKDEGADEDHDQDVVVEAKHRPKGGKKALLLVIGLLSCVIVAAGMAGWAFYKKEYDPESTKKKLPAPVQQMNVSDGETEQGLPQPRPSLVARGPATLVDRLNASLEAAANLRGQILVKLGEIDKLKRHFYQSIGRTEMEIYKETDNSGIQSYGQVLNNKKVELGLRTIQRREAYIRQLDGPSEWLERESQELLYVRRKTMIDMEASKIAGDIDLERLLTDLDGVIQKNRHGIENLTVDMGTAKLHPLETIWKRLTEEENPKRKGETNTQKRANKGRLFRKGNRDSEIWEQLCSGDYGRTGELTELSVQAAKCLSNIEVSDLFLNGLTQLSPEAAKYLMKWKGDWICLNGLKQILPETGKSLFQWHGKVISLNGLSKFPPELAPLLRKWQGSQLELMGLEPSDNIGQLAGIRALAQWEESGGKLHVPGDIRKRMRLLMGGSGS